MKKHYVIYDKNTGYILRHGTDEEDHVIKKANGKGILFLDVSIDNGKLLKVVNNKIVPKTESEINNEKIQKETESQQRRIQVLDKLRTRLDPEINEVDPNVISLLKKLDVIPQDL